MAAYTAAQNLITYQNSNSYVDRRTFSAPITMTSSMSQSQIAMLAQKALERLMFG